MTRPAHRLKKQAIIRLDTLHSDHMILNINNIHSQPKYLLLYTSTHQVTVEIGKSNLLTSASNIHVSAVKMILVV